MERILLLEDEDKMRKVVKNFLVKAGYEVIEACDGEEALELFYENTFDLAILDVMVPKIDGWTICRKIRKESKIPIIMLTARSTEDDELFGFDLGADEYITKPFSLKILLARVKVLLKRKESIVEDNSLKVGKLEIDSNSHRVIFCGEILDLTPKEYDMLLMMVKNKDIAISRERFLNQIWGFDYYGDLRTVDTHVKQLRKKLNGKHIKTVRGVGYRFEEE
ncbi:response regulator transcription factor [uncultured Ilyobacter sp.]|uniref:response regulator transcription factor n=1 Tax=uncultured Ilyobacter sp. TaxID=544433 RepID=UPI0029F4BE50|nr:response regulator transcription factor [uncultured Ilyobacter sp.]